MHMKNTPILQNENFVKLQLSNAAGRLADSLDAITFSWLMYLVSGNAALIALIFAANYLPTILLQPFSGVLADRCPKKRIIALADFGRVLLVLGTLLLYHLQRLKPWMLFPITLLVSTFESFRLPAGSALIPELIEKAQLKQANALNLTIRRICEAIGTAIAGIVIVSLECRIALLLDASLFFLSGVIILTITSPKSKASKADDQNSIILQWLEGLRYVRNHKELVYIIFLTAAFNFLSVPYTAFQSIYFGDALKFSADALSMANTLLLVSTGAGAWLISRKSIASRINDLLSAYRSLGFFPIFYIGLSLISRISSEIIRFVATLLMYILCGLITGFFSILVGSRLMEETQRSLFGRVSGLANAIGLSMVPISSLICSVLTMVFPLTGVYLCISGCGILILVSSVWLHRLFFINEIERKHPTMLASKKSGKEEEL